MNRGNHRTAGPSRLRSRSLPWPLASSQNEESQEAGDGDHSDDDQQHGRDRRGVPATIPTKRQKKSRGYDHGRTLKASRGLRGATLSVPRWDACAGRVGDLDLDRCGSRCDQYATTTSPQPHRLASPRLSGPGRIDPVSASLRQNHAPSCDNRKADDGPRTRDLRLGKPTLYQLSYVRKAVAGRLPRCAAVSPRVSMLPAGRLVRSVRSQTAR